MKTVLVARNRMTRKLSQAEMKTVFAVLVDAATLVRVLCRHDDNNDLLNHIHASLAHAVNVMIQPDVLE